MLGRVSFTGNATLDAIAAESGAATLTQAAEWFVLLGIELLFIIMRTWARISLSTLQGLGWDDFIAWVGLVSVCLPCLWSVEHVRLNGTRCCLCTVKRSSSQMGN